MDIVSAILLFGAALAGLFLMGYLNGNKPLPGTLVTIHTGLTALGIFALVIYTFTTEQLEKHYHTLVMLAVAGGVGLWLWLSNGSVLQKKALAIVYSLLGMFALLWLLTFIIP